MRYPILSLFVLLSIGVASAEPWRPLGLFEGKRAGVVWRAETGPVIRPMRDVGGHGPGLRLMCPFRSVESRCLWDAKISLDLSAVTRFSFWVQVRDPEAVSRGTLYFRSGEGWYAGWFPVRGEGWQRVVLPRKSFSTEGSPAGWGSVDGVRVALWKGSGRDTIVSLARAQGRSDEIVVIRNSAAMESHPDEARWVRRAADHVESWLSDTAAAVGRLDDADVADGLPGNCRLAILPYNPHPPESTLNALTNFVADGGRIVVAYILPPSLAPMLGLTGTTWSVTGPDANFATMRFHADRSHGFPVTMRQDSWNANIPGILEADVLATWENGAGVNRDMPAATINSNGLFIGHLLTDADSGRKTQFLLAAIARLLPDTTVALARDELKRADRLLSTTDWESTQAFLLRTAKEHDRASGVSSRLDAISRYRAGSVALLGSASFGEILVRADVTRTLIQDAYCSLVSSRGVRDEFRGAWCHAADGVPGRTWDDAVRTMKANGCNALLANLLWPGLAFFPSSTVPVAPLACSEGDLLEQCLNACRKHDVELHLWKVCWDLTRADPAYVETLRAEGRLQRKRDGSEVLWLCPSDPRNRQVEITAVVDAVSRYPVDGLHFDYIRYPSANSCYCDGCRERFGRDARVTVKAWPADVAAEGALRRRFLEWRRNQITTFVAASSSAIRAARPGVKISAAVFSSWPSCRDSVGQDWARWAKEGYVDFLCPMNYTADDEEALTLAEAQLGAVDGAVPIYPGIGPSTKGLSPAQVVHQVDLLRGAGTKGFVLFELDRDLLESHLPALRAGATGE